MTDKHTEKEARIAQAAKRALKEASERKEVAKPVEMPEELGGRDGPEPIRFGDWEKRALRATSNFLLANHWHPVRITREI